jgi:excisionase family DNA binding protein
MGDAETYLKTQQVANALGVSVSTIKRWVDAGAIEATRTMGKHRLVTLSSALKFARQEKFPVDNLLAIQPPLQNLPLDGALIERFIEALRLGRIGEVRNLVNLACESRQGSVALADQLIRPAMEQIGHRWMLGTWDIYQEHQATSMIASILMERISRLYTSDHDRRPLAIGASPEGDPYLLPGLLGELVLVEIGWNVKNLSNNLPLRSLAKATREFRPRIVFLSASHVADRDTFIRDYSYFYEAASQVGSAIILGGRGLDPDLRSNLVYASFGERMAHLAEFARRLLPASEANLDATSTQPDTMNSQA